MHLAFPSLGWWPMAAVGIAMLWYSIEHATIRVAFGYGMLSGLAFFLPHLWWAYTSVGWIPWLALSLLQSVAFGLVAAAWAYVRSREMLGSAVGLEPLLFGLIWVSAEQLRSYVPFGGFPWGRLAFSQADAFTGRLAWLGGAPLVSFAVAVTGAALALGFEAARAKRVLLSAGAVFAGAIVTVIGIVIPLDTQAESGVLNVVVVQGNAPNKGLDAFVQARLVTNNHAEVTHEVAAADLPEYDLVIWPENSADIDPRVDHPTFEIITGAAQAVGVPILIGAIDRTPEEGRLNTSILWSPDGEALDTYSKQHPAPFAEYIPMRDFARLFSDEVDRVTLDMIAGEGPATIDLDSPRLGRTVVLGDIICFEVAYDSIVRDSISNGGEVLIVQTNNASFGITSESKQQLAMTRIRAIETGRATIQSSTVGVSGVVSPDGTLLQSTGLFEPAWMYAEVPLRTSKTPAMVIGYPLEMLFLFGPLALFAIRIGRGLRGRWDWD